MAGPRSHSFTRRPGSAVGWVERSDTHRALVSRWRRDRLSPQLLAGVVSSTFNPAERGLQKCLHPLLFRGGFLEALRLASEGTPGKALAVDLPANQRRTHDLCDH